MKRTIFILLAALSLMAYRASAQVNLSFDFDLYPDYYSYYDDDIYRYGFNINNYAVHYEDRFVTQVYREYGISRSVIRRYLRRGFSPSDILFGAELAYRTGNRFQWVMDGYYNSPSRNWLSISVNLGIPYGSPRFNLILGSFNRYYMDWGNYYRVHRPHYHPPMYHNDWSYFRPSPTPHRPPHYNQPNYRPSRPGQGIQPGNPGHNNRPSTGNNSTPNRRPETTPGNVRPGNNNRPSTGNNSTPGRRPETNPGTNRPGQNVQPGSSSNTNRPSTGTNSTPNRRPESGSGSNTAPGQNVQPSNPGSSTSGNRQPETRPSQPNRQPAGNTGSSSNSSSDRRGQPATAPSNNSSRNDNSTRGSSSSSSNNSSSGSSTRRSGSNSGSGSSSSVSRSSSSSSSREGNSSSRSRNNNSNSSNSGSSASSRRR